MTTATPTSPPPAVATVLLHVARDIKLSHTVFALPFALLAMMLAAASADRGITFLEVALILGCMFFARTVAMTVNRWADAKLDADNPRTAGRAIPSGQVKPRQMQTISAISALGFIVCCLGFGYLDNWWPVLLSPLVLLYISAYAWMKRFTWLCHVYLGTALALSPLAATIAIEPSNLNSLAIWSLAAMVACWVAGFDVLYALADVNADREAGTYSMPASLGITPALWISRLLHLLCAGCLIAAWWFGRPDLSVFFLVAVGLTIVLLIVEHTLIALSGTKRLQLAFLTLNGIISLLLGAAGILDILLIN